jgi:hypothetical protein
MPVGDRSGQRGSSGLICTVQALAALQMHAPSSSFSCIRKLTAPRLEAQAPLAATLQPNSETSRTWVRRRWPNRSGGSPFCPRHRGRTGRSTCPIMPPARDSIAFVELLSSSPAPKRETVSTPYGAGIKYEGGEWQNQVGPDMQKQKEKEKK